MVNNPETGMKAAYDLSIICDENPRSRRIAAVLSRKLRAFSYCANLELGGAVFHPRQVTDSNYAAVLGAVYQSKKLAAILSFRDAGSNAAKLALRYAEMTGKQPVYICSDIASLEKAKESCPFGVAYTGASLMQPTLFNAVRYRLKADLAGVKWSRVKHALIRLSGFIETSVFILAFLTLLAGGIWYVNKHSTPVTILEMSASALLSQSKFTGVNFVSDDGTLYGDMQRDGSLLVRRTSDNTIRQSVATAFADTAVQIQFSTDNRRVLVSNGQASILYDIDEKKELFRLPQYTETKSGCRFINGGKWIASWAGQVSEITKVSIFDSANGGLLYSHTDPDGGFSLWGFTRAGDKLVGNRGESSIWVWDFVNRTEAYNADAYASVAGSVDFLPFSGDGKYYLEKTESRNGVSGMVASEVRVCACSDESVLSTVRYQDKGYSRVSFGAAGRVLVLKEEYFAVYDQYTGTTLCKIPAKPGRVIQAAALIDNTKYALIYTKKKGEDSFLLSAVDISTGRIVAERAMAGYFVSIRLFPEEKSFFVSTADDGHTALLFRYVVRDDGIHFED